MATTIVTIFIVLFVLKLIVYRDIPVFFISEEVMILYDSNITGKNESISLTQSLIKLIACDSKIFQLFNFSQLFFMIFSAISAR